MAGVNRFPAMKPGKRYHEHSGVALWITGIFLCVISAWASGYTALWGGKAAGLSRDAWNWQDLPFYVYGWLGGAIAGPVLFIAVRKTLWRFALVIMMPLLAFWIGAAFQAIEKYKDRKAAERTANTAD